ncbi:tryptophan 2,3-dioxygenase family protein [Fulvivirga lutimaris]|uniref:tryptophan 2,3-dioxygenase family protein n=1 Tax=Fulvivirga lutimaris TaxID=1819566 RepID=UPI0012BC93A0|nr:tryptophan 2,3-dioxygenase family protein [Fulvivirga lutimaris]MTI39245.1 tryptophan 2,3-dioxygenase [Fulvivirga lutimaris]
MNKSEIDPKIVEQIKKLEEKYEVMGQDLSSYLDGLLYSDYLTYWDYIHLDTLLSLQNPKTGMKDEMIFITYHQHTELFFKLILWEIDQIAEHENINEQFFLYRLKRINGYFKVLENSFSVMVEGMDKDQFLKFRMSLLPASGFQSAQYRLIEISSTDLINLTDPVSRKGFSEDTSIEELIDKIYWRSGATELASGKKTLTLRQFEEKYNSKFLHRAKAFKEVNLLKIYEKHFGAIANAEIIDELRAYDAYANVYWPLAHYKSAVRYLQRDPEDIAATGGTNWQKYLPPRFQKIIFFPSLWSDEERAEWGKSWVLKEVFQKQ